MACSCGGENPPAVGITQIANILVIALGRWRSLEVSSSFIATTTSNLMFSYRKTASCGAAVLASCISLLAQGQPNAKESRRVGLDVLGIQQTVVNGAQGGVTLTVHAPAGSVYDLAFEGSVASADLHLVVPGVLGTFALNPTSTAAVWFYGAAATSPPAGVFGVPMASFFVDPNGGMPGVIPAGATSQTLVSTFETQVGAVATFQALVVEPFAPGGAPTYRVTNGQQRFIVPPALTLATSGFTTGQGALITVARPRSRAMCCGMSSRVTSTVMATWMKSSWGRPPTAGR